MTRFRKYFVTGMIAAVVDFALFASMVKLAGWPRYIAGTVSFTAATLVNYVMSIRHVFVSGVRYKMRTEIALTFAVSLIGLAVNQVILFLLIRRETQYCWPKSARLRQYFVELWCRQHLSLHAPSLPVRSKRAKVGYMKKYDEVARSMGTPRSAANAGSAARLFSSGS